MSVTVVIGTNRFTDCASVLSYKDQPVLRVTIHPLRLTLKTPQGPNSVHAVVIDENSDQTSNGQPLRIVANPSDVAILWNQMPVVLATHLEGETVHVRLDLRPLGINIYDDAFGLHIGSNVLSNNSFVNCATAISLG